MKVTSTLSRQAETTERKLTLPNFVYFGLRDTARTQNKEFSQGKIIYEILHFDREKPCSDEISEIEDFVDRQLSEELGEQSPQLVDKIKIIDADGRETISNVVPDDLEPTENSNTQVRVRLPDETWSQIHSEKERYIGEWIAPSLIEFVESPFDSRMERINCKRELVEYLQGSVDVDEVESEVARACITGESDRFVGISEVYDLIIQNDGSDRWYLNRFGEVRDDISLDEIRHRGIPQKPRTHRIEALEQAIENSDEQPSPEEVQKKIIDIFGVKENTARTYVEEMEMSWVSYVEVTGVLDLAKEIKSDHVNLLPESERGSDTNPRAQAQRMPIHEFLMVNKDALQNADGRYDTREEAEEALEALLERDGKLSNTKQKDAHEDFTDAIDELIEKGYELLFIAEVVEHGETDE